MYIRSGFGSITLRTAGATAALLVLTAGSATALPGGPWASRSVPATAVTYAYIGAAGYGTWQGVRNDQGRGDRMQGASSHRDPSGYNGGPGAYVRYNWFWNGTDCYVSSFSVSKASVGIGRSCDDGRWSGAGKTETGRTQSKTWQYWETWKNLSPKASSGRAQIRTCYDFTLQTDPCSGSYLRGANY